MYDFRGKFALVTGGGRGIGFACTRELLRNGIEGVTLVDVDGELVATSREELNREFGGKVISVQADVSNADQLRSAFKTSLSHWKFLDIVINNAGVMDEGKLEWCLSINCGGTYRGSELGFQYMNKEEGGRGGTILNIASVSGITPHYAGPIYSGSKSFIISLGRAMGTPEYFNHSGVKVLTLCPGLTATQLVANSSGKLVSNVSNIKERIEEERQKFVLQSPECVAKAMITIVREGRNGSVWVVENTQPLYEVEFLPRLEMKKESEQNLEL